MSDSIVLQVAHITPFTEAEGPGKRFALWFQGCPLRCPGCCNPEYLPFKGGTSRTVASVLDEIEKSREEFGIEGITLLGGEPFAHAAGAAPLAEAVRERGLSVMAFTGFTVEEIQAIADTDSLRLLASTDLLVDGPYLRDQPDTERRWIGSRNQRIHFLTSRYSFSDPCWRQRNTLEIRVRGREVQVNGFPSRGSVELWKGWKRKKT